MLKLQYSHPRLFNNITITITSLGCINHFALSLFLYHRFRLLRIQSEELVVAASNELNIAVPNLKNHLGLHYCFKQPQRAAIDSATDVATAWLLPI